MKIGFEAKRAFHNFRGLGNYSRSLIEGLVSNYPENEYFLYTPEFHHYEAKRWENLIFKSSQVKLKKPEKKMYQYFPGLWRSFFQSSDIENEKLDLYHGLSHELPSHIDKIGIASIVTIHDLIFLRFPHLFPRVDRMVYKYKFKQSCQRANKIIAICEQTKRDLIDFLMVPERKIEVLYQCCHPRFYKYRPLDIRQNILQKRELSKPYILYVGAFEERKNILSIIQAFSHSNSKRDYELVLVGRGQPRYLTLMKEAIVKYKVEDQVRIFMNVGQKELPFLYQGASLFVFPSLFEGFGLPIVEALFSRVPVITSQGSCFPESGGPKTRYTKPGDIDEIKESIDEILTNPRLADEMISLGHKYAHRFHVTNTSSELMKFYKKVT